MVSNVLCVVIVRTSLFSVPIHLHVYPIKILQNNSCVFQIMMPRHMTSSEESAEKAKVLFGRETENVVPEWESWLTWAKHMVIRCF